MGVCVWEGGGGGEGGRVYEVKCRGKMKGNMGEKLRYKDTLCSRQLCIQMLNTQEQGNEVHVQLAEHWTSNPVVTGSNPVRGSSVFFTVCLWTMPYIVLPSFAYTCTRFDHVHVHVDNIWEWPTCTCTVYVCTGSPI